VPSAAETKGNNPGKDQALIHEAERLNLSYRTQTNMKDDKPN